LLVLLAAAAAVVGGLLAWRNAAGRIAAEDALGMARGRQKTAAMTIEAREQRLAALLQEKASLERTAASAPQAGSPMVPAAGKPPARRTEPRAPEEIAGSLRRFRAGLGLDYAPFYRLAGFSPGQRAKFDELLVEHFGREEDIVAARMEQGLTENDPAIRTLQREESARFEAALRDFLGAEDKRTFDEYRAALPERKVVGALAGSLVLGDAPLTPAQTQSLARALHDFRGSGRLQDAARWEPVLARARTFLSDRQWEELRAQAVALQHEALPEAIARLAAPTGEP
jgi:hypothetical protein